MSVSELVSSGRAAANSLLDRKRGGLDGRGGARAAASAVSSSGRAPAMPWPGALEGRSWGAGVGGGGMRWPLVKGCGCLAGAPAGPAGRCRESAGSCRESAVMAGTLDCAPEASAYWTPWCDMARAARRWEGAEDRDAEDGDGAGDVEGGILAAAAVGWGWGWAFGGGWDWRSERAVMVKVNSRSKNRHGSSFQPRVSRPGPDDRYRKRRVLGMGRKAEGSSASTCKGGGGTE